MADEQPTPETEELLLTEEVQPEDVTPEAEEEEIPAFGDEAPSDANESPTIRHMRKQLEGAHKEIAELKRSSAPKPISPEDLGPEPDLEAMDWDTEKFTAAVKERARKEARLELQAAPVDNEAQAAQIEATRQRIEQEKQALGKSDVDDAFDTVRSTLSELQQSLLVASVDDGNTAKLIYALAKNPEKLTALAAQTDIPRFIKEVAKLEGQLKMVKRRTPPDPDVPERGSAPTSVTANAAQKQLEKMEAEYARKGGDRTHIQRFKREHGLK